MRQLKILSLFLAACLAGLVLLACSTTGDKTSTPVYLIKIEKGDTLASIATKYDTSWQSIAKLNKLDDRSNIEIGKILRVRPGPGGIVAGANSTPSRSKLAQRLPRDTKSSRARLSNAGDLPNRPAAEPSQYNQFEEEDINGAESQQNSNGTSAPKKRRGLFYNDDSATATGGQLAWPVRGDISSGFGMRSHRMHQGIDIRAPYGTEIFPAAAGRIVFEGRKSGYGRCVIIQHQNQQTLYAHLSSSYVDEGDVVDRDTLIGKVGTSGNANGAHLHFEVRSRAGKALNPIDYLARERYLSSRVSDASVPVN